MKRRTLAMATIVAAVAASVAILLPAGPASALGGAGFTTAIDDGSGNPAGCLDSPNGVNCNNYASKTDVYLNGGPSAGGLDDGTYYFAVLVPGFQNGGFIDGSRGNLSDTATGGTTGDNGSGDDSSNREFTVTSNEVDSNLGSHANGTSPQLPGDSSGRLVIQLAPYDDTSNNGGVYILAICEVGATKPSQCKFDAFRIETTGGGGTTVQSCISGAKYRDDNQDGKLNPTESLLKDWHILVTDVTDPGSPALLADIATDDAGVWSFCTDAHAAAPGTTTLDVNEVLQSGWKQTGNTVDQTSVLGAAAATLNADKTYDVQIPNDSIATVDGLYFGNIPQGSVSGEKYFDANANGKLDANESGIAGWKIDQTGDASATLTTAGDGTFSTTLDPGSYGYSEEQPTNTSCATSLGVVICTPVWIQTGNSEDQTSTSGGATASLSNRSYSVGIPNDQPSTVSGLYFGNICLGRGGGLTLGFWSNKNGGKILGADAGVLAFLSSLNLRNGDGSNFDPTSVKQFQSWLLNAKATNMAYMLSAQLAAMELNVREGFVSASAVVYAPGSVNANANGFVDISTLMNEANAELGLHGLTKAGSPYRAYQQALKDALDKANNNLTFVRSSAASCPTPTFS